jgi:hypothetical protein
MLPIRSNAADPFQAVPGKTSFLVQNGRDVPFQTGFVEKWCDLFSGYKDRQFEGA